MISFLKKKKRFNRICKDIKQIKIQGATNIAKKALEAYYLFPSKKTKKKLLLLRPTEPLLLNVLERAEKQDQKDIIKHFEFAQEKINKNVFKIFKSSEVIFTHCHSTNVVKSLIYTKKNKKKFQVYNTETRPLYQGRKTSKELSNSRIKVTQFVDSAAKIALIKKQSTKKVSKVFFGADALLKNGAINKVGSGMFAQIAYDNKIPVYIVADSWKYSPKNIKLEERNFYEVWKKLSKKSHVEIKNPAFELIPKKYIKAVISELGILSYDEFIAKRQKFKD